MSFVIILWLIFGAITASMANKRNRNTLGWFVIGFILGIFGPIIISMFPTKQK